MDWDIASSELQKPLSADAVKPPPAGKYGEYVDGLHVITEANRIFGHGGWSYEVTRLHEAWSDIVEPQGKPPQYRCAWVCSVKVNVGGTIREGVATGSGNGRPENAGDMIESAVKEAETDALKRALRTFGNTFGLALYEKDKSKRQVERPKTTAEKVNEAETADQINALISEVRALDNQNATKHLHARAISLGLTGCKATGKYIAANNSEGNANE